MKVAVLSDIHSNLTALEAVVADAEKRGAKDFWCLGDIVGYGAEPKECLAFVREKVKVHLAGNHDLGISGAISMDDFNDYCRRADQWNATVLDEKDLKWLKGLPSKTTSGEFTLAHGSPRDPVWEYVVNQMTAIANFPKFKTDYCLVGHSHMPFVCKEVRGNAPEFLLANEEEHALTQGRFIINPGSVGQPRDGDSRSSYAIIDTDALTVRHHRVKYDIATTQKRMRNVGLPSYLIDRLTVGR